MAQDAKHETTKAASNNANNVLRITGNLILVFRSINAKIGNLVFVLSLLIFLKRQVYAGIRIIL